MYLHITRDGSLIRDQTAYSSDVFEHFLQQIDVCHENPQAILIPKLSFLVRCVYYHEASKTWFTLHDNKIEMYKNGKKEPIVIPHQIQILHDEVRKLMVQE